MARTFLGWGLALAFLGALAAGCDIFSPQSSKSTIEVSFNMPGSACGLTANLDGNNQGGVSPGTTYTFPAVSPGTHTVNLSSANGCNGGTPCQFQNGSTNYSDTFQSSAGKLAVVVITQGGSCYNMVVSGP